MLQIQNYPVPCDMFYVHELVCQRVQIIWYPLFGQLYVLANHLRIDRTNSAASIQSMRKVEETHMQLQSLLSQSRRMKSRFVYVLTLQIAKAVVDRNLSVIVFPEGTRSATGRLLPFKKVSRIKVSKRLA